MRVGLDRALPIPISLQLKGQIEYGIASGVLKAGDRLPSVRELAAAEGIAQVTVSHVYGALKRDGLIAVRPGLGTYIAATTDGLPAGESLTELRKLVDMMVSQSLEAGFSPTQISHMVTARLANGRSRRPVVAMVGLFAHATAVYAGEVAALLKDLSAEVLPYTVDQLRLPGAEVQEYLLAADVVLTLPSRVKEVQELLGPTHPPVHGITFVTHSDTIRTLQAIAPERLLGVVSTFAEFLPTMLQGVSEHIRSERAPLCAVITNARQVNAVLKQAEVIIYASGSEAIIDRAPGGTPMLEYLHRPEPASLEAVRPLLAGVSGPWPSANGERR